MGEILDIDWDEGAPEVATISIIVAVVFGLPLLLARNDILAHYSLVFYIVLFIFGFLGHIDDVNEEGFRQIQRKKLVLAIGLGLVGFLIIEITFLVGLTLLATGEATITMSKWEFLIFNICFVVPAEELVFRDTLPYYTTKVFDVPFKTENGDIPIAFGFILSSIAFGTLHIWTYGFSTIAVIKAILAGVILSLIRIRGGLFASYLAHLMYNATIIMGLFILPIV